MKRNVLFHYAVNAVLCVVVAGFFINCTPPEPTEGHQRNCVVMIGDSIFDWTGEITAALQELSGNQYRTYYESFAQMKGGLITDIETQYDNASRDGAIRTLIMDGGGNDFLFGLGKTKEEIMEKIRLSYMRIFDKAKADGVENIIIMGYYLTEVSPEGTAEDAIKNGADLEAEGAIRGIKTVYVNPNLDPWFQSRKSSEYTISDGAHPTTEAAQRLAQLIWDAMVANNIEQGEACPSSGTNGVSRGCN